MVWSYSKRIKLGAVLKDAFSAVSWSTSNEANTAKGDYVEFIPVSFKVGLATQPWDWWEIHMDYQPTFYEDGKTKIGFATEFLPIYFVKNPQWKKFLQIRSGWEQNLAETTVTASGVLGWFVHPIV